MSRDIGTTIALARGGDVAVPGCDVPTAPPVARDPRPGWYSSAREAPSCDSLPAPLPAAGRPGMGRRWRMGPRLGDRSVTVVAVVV